MKMMLKYVPLLLLFLLDLSRGDKLSQCGLAQILVHSYYIAKNDVANYIFSMVKFESNFDVTRGTT